MAMTVLPRLMAIGGGALNDTPALLDQLGLRSVLIVTDPYMAASGVLERLTGLLDAAGIETDAFVDTVQDPTTDIVEEGVRRLGLRAFGGLIGLGGGSPIDTAKAISILAANGGRMRDYKVPNPIPRAGIPVLAIPTTAGTGSEATRFTVITDTETDEKMLIAGSAVTPVAAIVDYELTLSCPARLTADTGIDALTHAIEAYVSKRANPFSDRLALSAMELIAGNIRTACAMPGDPAAREAMMLGATQAGMAFSASSVALVHGMSRPIGAFFHVPHGLSNAMLLPEITAFSASGALARYALCAVAIGLVGTGEGDQSAVARLIEGLRALNRDLEVPTPASYGVDETRFHELIPTMVRQAIASGSPANNPRVPTETEIAELYRQIYA